MCKGNFFSKNTTTTPTSITGDEPDKDSSKETTYDF